jgi:transposase
LGEKHLCFFVRGLIERLDMSVFEQSYSIEGGELYAPQLMLGVWLYAYALGITSARQVERRVVEDLAFRYLAAGERLDNWALSAFRRRHGRALNDAFTQVLEWARQQGMVKLGRVAIDSTRIAANASKDRVDSEQALRDTRVQLRRQVRAWQKAADRDDQEPGGLEVAIGELNKSLAEMPRRLERLKKSGLKKLSRTDVDARFMRQRGDKFVLGYSAEITVSDDHLIVAQRVTQNVTDNGSLVPMLDQTEQRCGAPPGAALADSGFFSIDNLNQMEQRNIDAYVPDSNMARALNLGGRCRTRACAPEHRRMRAKLRSPAGEAAYARRKAVVEPVFGVLKQQRGMRQFRTRGLKNVNNEFTLATLAFNITRLHVMRAA